MTAVKEIDPEVAHKAKERLEWLVGFMVVRYHFVYRILGMMTKVPRPGMGTMGVRVLSGGHFELSYDPVFVQTLSDEALTYVFYHEVLHLALHHCTTRKFDDHNLGNIAHDLAANELIPVIAGSCEPPHDEKGNLMGCFVSELKKQEMFKDIEEKQTSEWYYDYLKKKQKEMPQVSIAMPGQGEGDDQSGEGNDQTNGNQAALGKAFDDHGDWKEDEVADERVRAKIGEIAKNNLWGNMSATDKERILAAQVARINWRSLLKRFYGNQVWHECEATRKRPNRRTGLVHPGRKKVTVDRHLVAVDTSGSTYELLDQFLGVLNQMVDYVPIDVMQFDCQKTEDPKPFNKRRKEFDFIGLGGTNFNPVIETADKYRYKSVVIVTDGEAPAPPTPKSAKVAWVLPEGKNPPVEWGTRIHMRRHG